MKTTKVGKIVRWIYAKILRPVILKEINNPDSELDEQIMAILDKLFKYKI